MKKFMTEFREFISRGNVMDMAVGVIIGSAFSGIVGSLISDILMPALGIFLGGVDFSAWVVSLPNLYGGEPVLMNLGMFINTVVNFLVLALAVFLMVRGVNRMRRKKEEVPPPAPKTDPQVELLTEIRDLLKK
ncbi:MAG: large-conductance mechanosensitive channel protein MscL [Clostridiaceae bacterium]|nr:large-conductance mechanosensitive channel protein MscL [Clostridiaceae bacterium]